MSLSSDMTHSCWSEQSESFAVWNGDSLSFKKLNTKKIHKNIHKEPRELFPPQKKKRFLDAAAAATETPDEKKVWGRRVEKNCKQAQSSSTNKSDIGDPKDGKLKTVGGCGVERRRRHCTQRFFFVEAFFVLQCTSWNKIKKLTTTSALLLPSKHWVNGDTAIFRRKKSAYTDT